MVVVVDQAEGLAKEEQAKEKDHRKVPSGKKSARGRGRQRWGRLRVGS